MTNTEVANAIKTAFGETPAKLISNHTLDGPIAALKDSLIVIKLMPEEHRRPVEELARQLRDLDLILKVAGDSSFPETGANLHGAATVRGDAVLRRWGYQHRQHRSRYRYLRAQRP